MTDIFRRTVSWKGIYIGAGFIGIHQLLEIYLSLLKGGGGFLNIIFQLVKLTVGVGIVFFCNPSSQ